MALLTPDNNGNLKYLLTQFGLVPDLSAILAVMQHSANSSQAATPQIEQPITLHSPFGQQKLPSILVSDLDAMRLSMSGVSTPANSNSLMQMLNTFTTIKSPTTAIQPYSGHVFVPPFGQTMSVAPIQTSTSTTPTTPQAQLALGENQLNAFISTLTGFPTKTGEIPKSPVGPIPTPKKPTRKRKKLWEKEFDKWQNTKKFAVPFPPANGFGIPTASSSQITNQVLSPFSSDVRLRVCIENAVCLEHGGRIPSCPNNCRYTLGFISGIIAISKVAQTFGADLSAVIEYVLDRTKAASPVVVACGNYLLQSALNPVNQRQIQC